jgi:CO dehydrogenase nickel-insertion accessory protein CooC1
MESVMEKELHKREVEILGAVKYDPIVAKAGLEGTTISRCKALEDIAKIIESLDK